MWMSLLGFRVDRCPEGSLQSPPTWIDPMDSVSEVRLRHLKSKRATAQMELFHCDLDTPPADPALDPPDNGQQVKLQIRGARVGSHR